MGQRIVMLIIKELLAALRDRRGRYILIVPPLVQLLVFSFAATQEVKNVRMAVLNEDYGTVARDLIARFEGAPHFSEVRHLRGQADIAPALDSRSVLMVLHINPDFSRAVAAGRQASVHQVRQGSHVHYVGESQQVERLRPLEDAGAVGVEAGDCQGVRAEEVGAEVGADVHRVVAVDAEELVGGEDLTRDVDLDGLDAGLLTGLSRESPVHRHFAALRIAARGEGECRKTEHCCVRRAHGRSHPPARP